MLLAVVGFGAVVQVRTNDVDDSLSTLREQDLVDVLSGLAGTSQRARTEIDRLERVKRGLETTPRCRPERWPRPSRGPTRSASWPAPWR